MALTQTDLPLRIGNYRPVSKLGEGGMGVVYRAVHVDDPTKEVALKVILGGLTNDTDAIKRFQRESRILERLRHPNVVSILEVGTDGDRRFFAMELLDGVTLSAYAGQPWQDVLPLFIQVGLGMEYLALRKIIHRDISPGNILVVSHGPVQAVKVLDFGIAKNLEAEDTLASFTKTGLLMGKPAFWSPEQLGALPEGQTIDWKSDVYACGVVFFFILSGRLPISADSPYSFASAHLSVRPEPVEAPPGRPPLPASVVDVVARMLEKSRDDRPASWREIIDVCWEALPDERRTRAWPAGLPESPLPAGTVDSSSVGGKSSTGIRKVIAAARAREAAAAEPIPDTEVLDELEEVPAETAPMRVPPPPVPVRPGPRKAAPVLPIAAAAVAAAAILTGGYLALRPKEPGPVTLPEPKATPVAPAPTASVPEPAGAQLALDALPWARVLVVTDDATGKVVPIRPDETTPTVLALAPGRYRIDLSCGPTAERREVTVTVASTGVTSHVEKFESSREAVARLD